MEGGSDLVPHLIESIPDSKVRDRLSEMGQPAIPAIKSYLQNKPGEEERDYAMNALKKIEGNK